MLEEIINKINNSLLFRNYNRKDIIKLIKKVDFRIIDLDKKDFLMEENILENYIILIKGCIKVETLLPNGDTVLFDYLKDEGSLGLVNLHTKFDYDEMEITAIEDSSLLILEKSKLINLIDNDKRLNKEFLKYSDLRLYYFFKKFEVNSINNSSDKILLYLKNKINFFGKDRFVCNRSQMAEDIKVSRSTLYRVFDELEKNKIICFEGRELIIKNKDLILNMEKI